MIIKFENGNTTLATQIYENNETGELTVQDTYNCTAKNEGIDTIFGTNDQEITIKAHKNEQTWDTKEISMIIESDMAYYNTLSNTIGNELYFIVVLYVIIGHWNEKLGDASKHIDPSNVNGNEVYISFCETFGNEQDGWE